MLVVMRCLSLAIPLSVIALSGCLDEQDFGETSQAVTIENRISFNRISFNRISFNRISFNRISFNRISFNRLSANMAAIGDMLDTEEGREVFSFVIGCALPEGEVLVAPDPEDPDNTLEFYGDVGLAPDWIDRPMSKKDRRWVTACILSRVNESSAAVNISLRGDHPGLATDAAERAAYTLQEGAFFGDVFENVDGPLRAYACRGRAQRWSEQGDLASRDCAEPDFAHPGFTKCGMTYAGECDDFLFIPGVCNKERQGAFANCKTALHQALHIRNSWTITDEDGNQQTLRTSYEPGVFQEVITTYVQP